MRLIDADRLLSDRAKSTYYHLPNGDTAIPIIDIEHAPTVDAVEVVRCKDCKRYTTQPEIIHCESCEHWKNEHICECLSRYGTFETPKNFYCGYGKEK